MTTDEENELICEKLLGWKRLAKAPNVDQHWNDGILGGDEWPRTPSFDTEVDIWLILIALPQWELEKHGDCFEFAIGDQINRFGDTPEEAIRAAAIDYIKAAKS